MIDADLAILQARSLSQEIERLRTEVLPLLCRQRDLAMRRAASAGLRPPTIARAVGVSISTARNAATPRPSLEDV